jgi:hypothetical protein
MSQIRYVVAALPRSGTKYISTVLTKMGLACGHERHFRTGEGVVVQEDGPEIFGDASWMVVPYIHKLPPGTVVFHQLRNPLKVLNSNLPPGGDSYFRTWDENAGLASDPLYNKAIPWKRFIREQTEDWVWPEGASEHHEGPGEIARLIHWWMNWNLWIEYASLQRSDLVYVRYKLEDLNVSTLAQIQLLIDPSSTAEVAGIEKVMEDVSTTTNRHREPNNKLTLDDLPPAARLLMYRYGYND